MIVFLFGDFCFIMWKEELKIKMEGLDDVRDLRKWLRFGIVILGSIDAN